MRTETDPVSETSCFILYTISVDGECPDHATPLYPQKLALNFVDKWRSSVGIVRLRTKGHGVLALQIRLDERWFLEYKYIALLSICAFSDNIDSILVPTKRTDRAINKD
jgi:hypothetical protein